MDKKQNQNEDLKEFDELFEINELSDMNELSDIQRIQIDTSLPKEERIRQFFDQIKNPYRFRCGDMVIQISFADNGISLSDRIEQYFRLAE